MKITLLGPIEVHGAQGTRVLGASTVGHWLALRGWLRSRKRNLRRASAHDGTALTRGPGRLSSLRHAVVSTGSAVRVQPETPEAPTSLVSQGDRGFVGVSASPGSRALWTPERCAKAPVPHGISERCAVHYLGLSTKFLEVAGGPHLTHGSV